MRLIDADELIPLIKMGEMNTYSELGEGRNDGIAFAIERINQMPTIFAYEPKKGKWIKRDSYDRRDNFYSCSICGRIINVICGAHLEDYPFCHCGADMRGRGVKYE